MDSDGVDLGDPMLSVLGGTAAEWVLAASNLIPALPTAPRCSAPYEGHLLVNVTLVAQGLSVATRKWLDDKPDPSFVDASASLRERGEIETIQRDARRDFGLASAQAKTAGLYGMLTYGDRDAAVRLTSPRRVASPAGYYRVSVDPDEQLVARGVALSVHAMMTRVLSDPTNHAWGWDYAFGHGPYCLAVWATKVRRASPVKQELALRLKRRDLLEKINDVLERARAEIARATPSAEVAHQYAALLDLLARARSSVAQS